MSKQHVLIVDDDLTYREMLSDIFSDYDTTTANNGKEAIQSFQNRTPDIIILDVMMPEMDGYEVCKAIRAFEETASTPVVFYSSLDSLEGRLKAYDLGGNDYISKECSKEEVRAKIVRLLTSEQERVAIKQDLKMGNILLENMQKESSALHVISQFSQACQFCFDFECLSTVLFNCLFKLNLRGVVCFRNEGLVLSSNGSHSKLEEEILGNAASLGRIYSFGENRVILNWTTCSLLVKDVGDNLDSLAYLMDALQTATRSIELHSRMVEKVLTLEARYRSLKSRLSGQSVDSSNLKEQLFDSGLISRFDMQDETELDDILSNYGNDLVDIFVDADESVDEINNLIKRIHVPPPELKALFEKKSSIYIENKECDDVLF